MRYLLLFITAFCYSIEMLPVPGGETIVGQVGSNESPPIQVTLKDFSIGKYEVTNAEFAAWLNQAKEMTVKEGIVYNKEGKPLFKTQSADPFSQITHQNGTFTPVNGKENHPVIDVTWYGTGAFCKDNNCRLPTEAEWERAASISKDKKFIFGFSRDTISPALANYRTTDKKIADFQVLTKQVGYYNGKNPGTEDAKSPVGAYDMSGNVWEWTADYWRPTLSETPPLYGAKKVAKGGCYDSLADGVRVAERLGLPLDHSDPYTGFRVAH